MKALTPSDRTKAEVVSIFADLVEEDPSVLMDLLIRLSERPRLEMVLRVAHDWEDVDEHLSILCACSIGAHRRELARVLRLPLGGWEVLYGLESTTGFAGPTRARSRAEGKTDAEYRLRGLGWRLFERPSPKD